MAIFRIAEVIVPIILIAAVGFIFGKFRKVNYKTLADLIIYVTAPALALTMLSRQQMGVREIATIAFAAVVVILAVGAISFLLFKVIKLKVPVGVYLPIMFMNSGFIGYPLALFTLGELGFSRALIFDITNAILIFTLGVYLVSRGKDRWQILKIPFVYAAIIGISLSFAGIRIPQTLYVPLYLLGSITIPLALFLLGCRLANIKIDSWKIPIAASILRIFLGLADTGLVASTIALSTIISIITIPLILNLFILN
jgi:predicted permease